MRNLCEKTEKTQPVRLVSTAAKIGAAMAAALGTTVARSLGRELIRGVFGMLGARPPGRTPRRRW